MLHDTVINVYGCEADRQTVQLIGSVVVVVMLTQKLPDLKM